MPSTISQRHRLHGERARHLDLCAPNALAMFEQIVEANPDVTLVRYFGRSLSVSEVDQLSDAASCALAAHGVTRGARVGLILQNVPEVIIAILAAWKLGAIIVPINPMYRARELETILNDAGVDVVVAGEECAANIPATTAAGAQRTIITCSAEHFAGNRFPHEILGFQASSRSGFAAAISLYDLIDQYAGQKRAPVILEPDDIAFLTYTSGTTGPPKGALNRHRNVVFSAQTYRDWIGIDGHDVILGIAPLFHITGLIAHVAEALLTGATLLLAYRFDALTVLDLIEAERPTYTVAAITALMALVSHPDAGGRDLTSLIKIYSGGQAVSATAASTIEQRLGVPLHIAYGMTETTSPSHLVPFGVHPPADPETGALSVGIPVFDTSAVVLGEDDEVLQPGAMGEIAVKGPQVVPGYWEKPSESKTAFTADGLIRTGDIGYMNGEGWFFVIDRKKDLINASGYKVWPREVEDVLCQHPDVVEAAVVGVSDNYRGETVKAFVSLTAASNATANDLIAFCRDSLAPYKCPRLLTILDEIPKNAAGKILRRVLRDSENAKADSAPG